MKLKKLTFIIAFTILTALLFGLWYFYPQLKVINGYAARTACSCYFEVGRAVTGIDNEDLGDDIFSISRLEIDSINQLVSSTVLGLAKKTAVYRKGMGCILLKDEDDQSFSFTPLPDTLRNEDPWRNAKSVALTENEMATITQLAFDPEFGCTHKKTRALLILKNDSLIYEQYAKGTDRQTPLLGWSMTKSVLSTLFGLLVQQGKTSLEELPFKGNKNPEYRQTRVKDLLQMRAGLKWEEKYDQYCSATQMLFDSDDAYQMAAALPFEKREWEYSSGTSNLLSGLMKSKFESTQAYLNYPYTALFHPLDLEHAWIETDETGTMLASSYMYATARDWLKLGMLYLNKGKWQGNVLLSPSWIDFVQEEATGSKGRYGGHFWLNKRGASYKDVPFDIFTMDGYQGQLVAIFPAQNMVVVRLGLADLDFNELLKNIVHAVEQ